ncbi:hypothetical protein TNCV_947071 [Trichonephila clavipes]|nr:hypothetical protein TNCV_947071 [Trichonephila clavipes]
MVLVSVTVVAVVELGGKRNIWSIGEDYIRLFHVFYTCASLPPFLYRFGLRPQGVLPQNWGETEQNRTVTYMVLKAKANDRRKSLALNRYEFRGPLSDVTVDQFFFDEGEMQAMWLNCEWCLWCRYCNS